VAPLVLTVDLSVIQVMEDRLYTVRGGRPLLLLRWRHPPPRNGPAHDVVGMRWNIRYQLLVPLLGLFLGLVGIATWTSIAAAERAARRQIEAQMKDAARTLCDAHFPLTQRVLEQVKALSGADYLLVTAGGTLTTIDDDAEPPPQIAAVTSWQALRLGPVLKRGGTSYVASAVRLNPSVSSDSGTLYLLYPESRWRNSLWLAVFPSLGLGILGSMALAGFAVVLAQRLSRRIDDLVRRTRRVAGGDFTRVPLTGGNDELRDLNRSINDMAEHLEKLQQAVQKNERMRVLSQVGGALVHQLRNGVTGARLALQLHARTCRQPVPDALAVALRQLLLVEEKLSRFLHFGQTEEQVRRRCDLWQLLDDSIALLQPRCSHASTELRRQPPGSEIPIRCNPEQIGHLFINVLTNAIEAAGPGGWVEVRACVEPNEPSNDIEKKSRAVIEILDSGPGLAPTLAGELFEPFATGKTDGIGLGLAVARQIVESHGGTINVTQVDGATCFRIELPVESAKSSVERIPAEAVVQ
jgi:signal transduction histidine kinase